MANKRKFRIYLAGPIAGCNEEQKTRWRNRVKQKYANSMEFIDPIEDIVDGAGRGYEIVKADLEAIANSDGILVNMWRESIGSAIGLVHAHEHGKPVAVADPNNLHSRVMEFYADVVTENELRAANQLKDILTAELEWTVLKSGERRDELFDRRKLFDAIRGACGDAGCDEFGLPQIVLLKVVGNLKKRSKNPDWNHPRNQIPASRIPGEVETALEEISEGIPAARDVLDEWRKSNADRPFEALRVPTGTGRRQARVVSDDVLIYSPKSHGTIWGSGVGRLQDIPSTPARKIFQTIWEVPGLTRIVLGRFQRGPRRGACTANLSRSDNSCVIEGVLYDSGEKGTLQTFSVRVQFDYRKDEILEQLESRLKERDLWADR